jgi:hypothetical protein
LLNQSLKNSMFDKFLSPGCEARELTEWQCASTWHRLCASWKLFLRQPVARAGEHRRGKNGTDQVALAEICDVFATCLQRVCDVFATCLQRVCDVFVVCMLDVNIE